MLGDDEPSQYGPSVSVILPVRNGAAYVQRAVAMISAQTIFDFECVIFDDASDDGTAELLRVAIGNDARFRIVRSDTRVGVAQARNLALESAHATWVWFADVDDRYDPRILEDLLSPTSDDVDMIVVGAVEIFREHSIELPMPRAQRLSTSGAMRALLHGEIQGYLWNKLFRRSVLGIDPFPLMTSKSDVCGLIPVLERCRVVALLPTIRYEYVRDAQSLTGSQSNRAENALAAPDLVALRRWSDRFDVSTADVALYGLRGACAFIHDSARHNAVDSKALAVARGRVTWSGVRSALLARSWSVAAKAIGLKATPRLYRAVIMRRDVSR